MLPTSMKQAGSGVASEAPTLFHPRLPLRVILQRNVEYFNSQRARHPIVNLGMVICLVILVVDFLIAMSSRTADAPTLRSSHILFWLFGVDYEYAIPGLFFLLSFFLLSVLWANASTSDRRRQKIRGITMAVFFGYAWSMYVLIGCTLLRLTMDSSYQLSVAWLFIFGCFVCSVLGLYWYAYKWFLPAFIASHHTIPNEQKSSSNESSSSSTEHIPPQAPVDVVRSPSPSALSHVHQELQQVEDQLNACQEQLSQERANRKYEAEHSERSMNQLKTSSAEQAAKFRATIEQRDVQIETLQAENARVGINYAELRTTLEGEHKRALQRCEEEIGKLTQRVEGFQRSNATANIKLERATQVEAMHRLAEARVKELEKELTALTAQAESHAATTTKLHEENQLLTSRNTKLEEKHEQLLQVVKARMKEWEDKAQQYKGFEELQERVSVLQRENDELRQSQGAVAEVHESRSAEALKELNEVKQAHATAMNDLITQHAATLAAKETEVRMECKHAADAAASDVAAAHQELVGSLNRELELLHGKVDSCLTEVATSRAEQETLSGSLEDAQHKLSLSQATVVTTQEANASLTEDVQALRTELRVLKRDSSDSAELRRTVGALEAKCKSLSGKVDAATRKEAEMTASVRDYQDAVEELNAKCQTLHSALHASKEEATRLATVAQEAQARAEESASEAARALEEARSSGAVQAEAHGELLHEVEVWKAKAVAAQQAHESLATSLDGAKQKITTLERERVVVDRELESYSSKLRSMEETIASLERAQVESASGGQEAMAALQKELQGVTEALEATSAKLEAQEVAARDAGSAKEEELKRVREELQRVTEALEIATTKVNAQEAASLDSETAKDQQLQRLNAELQDASERLSAKEAALTAAIGKTKALAADLDATTNLLEEREVARNNLERELQSARDELNELHSASSDTANAKDKELLRLREALEATSAILDAREAAARDAGSAKEEELKRVREELQRVTEALEIATTKVNAQEAASLDSETAKDQQLQRLNAELQDASERLSAKEAALTAAIGKTKALAADLDATTNLLEEREVARNNLERELQSARDELNELHSASSDTANGKDKELLRLREALEATSAILDAREAAARDAGSAKEEELKRVREELQRVTEALEIATTKVNAQEAASLDSETAKDQQLQRLNAELQDASERLSAKEVALTTAIGKTKALAADLDAATNLLEEREVARNNLERELQSARDELNAATVKLKTHESASSEKLSEQDEELLHLKEALDRTVGELSAERAIALEKLNNITKENARRAAEMNENSEQLKELEKTLSEERLRAREALHQAHSQHEEKTAALMAELDSVKSQLGELESKTAKRKVVFEKAVSAAKLAKVYKAELDKLRSGQSQSAVPANNKIANKKAD